MAYRSSGSNFKSFFPNYYKDVFKWENYFDSTCQINEDVMKVNGIRMIFQRN